jgi:hypothetical protein
MTKEQLLRAAQLLRAYSNAIDCVLYKNRSRESCLKDERDCDELAELLEQKANE